MSLKMKEKFKKIRQIRQISIIYLQEFDKDIIASKDIERLLKDIKIGSY